MEKIFPNGFESWMETHHEVVQHLTTTADKEGSRAERTMEQGGTGTLYELGQELTDQFETQFCGKVWDGEFYDTIEAWLQEQETK